VRLHPWFKQPTVMESHQVRLGLQERSFLGFWGFTSQTPLLCYCDINGNATSLLY